MALESGYPQKKFHTRWARLETIIQRHISILNLGWETLNSPFNPAGGRNSKLTSLLRNRKQISNPITGGESEIPPHENTRNRVKWIKFNFLMKCDWFYFGQDETLSESLKASDERLRKRTIQHTFNIGRQWPVLRRNTHTHTLVVFNLFLQGNVMEESYRAPPMPRVMHSRPPVSRTFSFASQKQLFFPFFPFSLVPSIGTNIIRSGTRVAWALQTHRRKVTSNRWPGLF